MDKKKKECDICGHEIISGDSVIHRIVPEEIAKQAGIIDARTATLCLSCGMEVQTWYRHNVYSTSYDTKAKRFISKPPTKMIEEYETAYKTFASHKKKPRIFTSF